VLDEHALDSVFGKIGIDGLATDPIEVVEAADEGGTAAALFVDDLLNSSCQFRDTFGKLTNRLLPLLDVRSLVVKEMVDDLNQVVGLGDVFVGDAGPSLVKDRALGGLEDDVVAG